MSPAASLASNARDQPATSARIIKFDAEGNRILDLHLGTIEAPSDLAAALLAVPGVVETGLFLGMCDTAFVGDADGRVARWQPGGARQSVHVDLSQAAGLAETGSAQ